LRARTQARDRERRLYVIRLTTSVRPSGTSNAAIYGDITYMDITHTTLYRVYITRIILSSLLCYNHYYYGEEIDYDCILFREHLALTNAAAQITLAQRASAVTSCLAESDVFVFATPKIAKVIIATLIETLVDKARFFVD